ncbi:DUF6161 domain-containing protein [Mesorhizobium sp. Ld1326N3]|uniref:DUF6161 domain-containing protein n=2 Tax=Mesorhizobium salmacidum TaxID=3015171 RepID=A0ABU8KZ04_9HYPH
MAGEARDWLKANGNTDDDIFTAFVAGLMYEFQPLFDIPASEIPSAVLPELSNYAALRAIEIAPLDSREGISRRLNDIATTANTLLDDIKSQTAAASNSIRELSEQLQERAATALQAAETAAKQAGEFGLRTKDLGDRIDSFQVDIEAKTQDAQDKLDSFLDAARARTAYQHIVKYWDDRANASWWALVLSSLVLAVLLVALPAFAVYENDVVVTLLKHLTDATSVPVGTTEPNAVVLTVATVSRLVVITIPLALYFWLIKLVVRFNMRSMLLMDDARQRSTIIETYYKMIEQQAATKEDRAMILQALCRPPPGHGGDSVDPPSLTDVVEKAVGKSVTP